MQLKNLETKFLGRNCIFYSEIDSTQNEIWRLIKSTEIKNGTLVVADIQTNGKGTHGRVWHTNELNNVAFSMFVQMDCYIEKIEGLTREIAHMVIDIFSEEYGIKLEIKPPNDIMYGNKKIGGILTEAKTISGNVKYLVIGIGMNNNVKSFPKEIENIATSLSKEYNGNFSREDIIAEFFNLFETEYLDMIK